MKRRRRQEKNTSGGDRENDHKSSAIHHEAARRETKERSCYVGFWVNGEPTSVSHSNNTQKLNGQIRLFLLKIISSNELGAPHPTGDYSFVYSTPFEHAQR